MSFQSNAPISTLRKGAINNLDSDFPTTVAYGMNNLILGKVSDFVDKDSFDEDNMIIPIKQWPKRGCPIIAPPPGILISLHSNAYPGYDDNKFFEDLKVALDFIRVQKVWCLDGDIGYFLLDDPLKVHEEAWTGLVPCTKIESNTETFTFEDPTPDPTDSEVDLVFYGDYAQSSFVDATDDGTETTGTISNAIHTLDMKTTYTGNQILVISYVSSTIRPFGISAFAQQHAFQPDGGTDPDSGLPTGYDAIADIDMDVFLFEKLDKTNIESYMQNFFDKFEYHIIMTQDQSKFTGDIDNIGQKYTAGAISQFNSLLSGLDDIVFEKYQAYSNHVSRLSNVTESMILEDIVTKVKAFYPSK